MSISLQALNDDKPTIWIAGTGKEAGDRHPKVSDNVLIGANATILGNIKIGKGAQVAAGEGCVASLHVVYKLQ